MKNIKLSMDELNRISPDEFQKSHKIPVTIVLDNIRSLNNIGSVFRTSDAFRLKKILLCGITAKPPHRDIHKTALGATETVEWEYYETTIEALELLQSKGLKIVGVEQTSSAIKLNEYTWADKSELAVVFGHEVNGIDQEVLDRCSECLEIPQEGTKHSLNVSVAAGVIIWELYRQYRQ